jgi:hypothetical protein
MMPSKLTGDSRFADSAKIKTTPHRNSRIKYKCRGSDENATQSADALRLSVARAAATRMQARHGRRHDIVAKEILRELRRTVMEQSTPVAAELRDH